MTRTQMWLGSVTFFIREHPATIDRGRIIYHRLPKMKLITRAPHWLTTFWFLKRLTKIVDMSGALTLFMDMSYCSLHCNQVKRVGPLPESRKEGRTEEAEKGHKMVRGRQ